MVFDPVRNRLEAYCHPISRDEIEEIELSLKKAMLIKQPEVLKAKNFPDVYPIKNLEATNKWHKINQS